MAFKTAEFKTAYLQHEIPMDAKVSENLTVGALCAYDAATNTFAGASTLATATHIIAQSDMTLEYGHIPVEQRDHRYNPVVKQSADVKKVAVFKIYDKDDIIVHA